jgi:Family of unknown function (DUF6328)
LHPDSHKDDHDRLLTDYNAIIRESSLLIAFTGILFGFLLNIAVSYAGKLAPIDQIATMAAIISITVAISLFIMPVVYHHLEYPYADLEKFKIRAHRFMLFGFIPTGLTMYLSLAIALSSFIGYFAFGVALLPFLLVYGLYLKRR